MTCQREEVAFVDEGYTSEEPAAAAAPRACAPRRHAPAVVEARGSGFPGALTGREVPPGRTRAQDPEDAIDRAAQVARLGTPSRLGQQGLQPGPLLIG